jgi:hypothetical protein
MMHLMLASGFRLDYAATREEAATSASSTEFR